MNWSFIVHYIIFTQLCKLIWWNLFIKIKIKQGTNLKLQDNFKKTSQCSTEGLLELLVGTECIQTKKSVILPSQKLPQYEETENRLSI